MAVTAAPLATLACQPGSRSGPALWLQAGWQVTVEDSQLGVPLPRILWINVQQDVSPSVLGQA